jgi:hypothetical protein
LRRSLICGLANEARRGGENRKQERQAKKNRTMLCGFFKIWSG